MDNQPGPNCTAYGTQLNVIWQPGWEGSLGENGYLNKNGWVPLLSTWNYHNIANWLYFRLKSTVKKKLVALPLRVLRNFLSGHHSHHLHHSAASLWCLQIPSTLHHEHSHMFLSPLLSQALSTPVIHSYTCKAMITNFPQVWMMLWSPPPFYAI